MRNNSYEKNIRANVLSEEKEEKRKCGFSLWLHKAF